MITKSTLIQFLVNIPNKLILIRIYCQFTAGRFPEVLQQFKPNWWIEGTDLIDPELFARKHGFTIPILDYLKNKLHGIDLDEEFCKYIRQETNRKTEWKLKAGFRNRIIPRQSIPSQIMKG